MYTFHSLDVSLEPMEIYSKRSRAACIYAPVKHTYMPHETQG